MAEFQLIKLDARTDFERGEEYGSKAKALISACVNTYREHLAVAGDMAWEQAREEVLEYIPLLEATMPALMNEVRGIAAGSGEELSDIMILNSRYELLHYPNKPRPNECTTFALMREATEDKKVYIGQNWDSRPMMLPHTHLLHITLADGTRVMGLTEAGQLIRNGFSSRGLGIVASSLNSSLDYKGIGIPGNFLRRRALYSKSIDEMAELVAGYHRAVANNYTVASIENRAIDIEAIPTRPVRFLPENGIITHANHIVSRPELDTTTSLKFRGERLFELLNDRAGHISQSYLKECLSDHYQHPRSVCSHQRPEKTDPHTNWQTNASIIYNLDELTMEICYGPPCEGEYKRYEL